MNIYVLGLDLGQARDYSALTIVEAAGTDYGQGLVGAPLTRCDVRHLHRYPLGTAYKAVVADVQDRIEKVPRPCFLAVDETGVGRPVMELLAHLKPHGITITSGDKATLVAGGRAHVPKRDLVGAAQVGLQNGVLRIASSLAHAKTLVDELLNFKAKITEAGHDVYAAWREKDHDDLVLAVAMATWLAREAFGVIFTNEVERRQLAMLRRSCSSLSI